MLVSHEDIFVATPHRIQRQAVKAALASGYSDVEAITEVLGRLQVTDSDDQQQHKGGVTIDTIERLQGIVQLMHGSFPTN